MTGSQTGQGPLITLADVAELAGVSRPAVSNWRKRFPDFPSPAAGTAGSPLYQLQEVEDWLRSRDKWVGRPGVEHRVWAALDSMRAFGTTESFLEAISAVLTLRLVALVPQRAHNAAEGATVEQQVWNDAWSRHGDRISALQRIAARVEVTTPSLRDVLLPPLERLPREAEPLVELLDDVPVDDSPGLLEAMVSMHRRATGRGGLVWTTSDTLTDLVVDMARPIASSVYDGAAGGGGFLLAAARAAKHPVELFGQEISPNAWRLATQRIIVHQLNGWIANGDTLRADAHPGQQAQTVLLDPPYNVSDWGRGGGAYDRPWPFGVPSANNADFAWVQQAISHVAPGGRAFVILPMGSLSRTSADARIRHELVRAGALEAVVALPPGLVSRTAIPLALWVLARPGEAADADRVLLVDAALDDSGSFAGRAKEISDLYRQWRARGTVESAAAVATPSRLDLLGIDANLIPARWVPTALEAVDADELLADLRQDTERLADKLSRLREVEGVKLDGFAASRGALQRASVGQLMSDGHLTLIRGTRVPREDLDADGDVAVITPSQVRDRVGLSSAECPRITGDTLDRLPERTQPGDVVVLTEGPQIRAAVVVDAGAITAAPLWLLRVRGEWIDPSYLAACMSSEWNLRYSVGSAIPRVPVRELEVPILPLAAQRALVQQLSALQDLRKQALDIAGGAETISRRLVDGVTAGVLDVDVSV